MRCRQVRNLVIDGNGASVAAVTEHLRDCPACAAYAANWERLGLGFSSLAAGFPPEPSLGFAMRLARSVQEKATAQRAGEVSFERACRRFIYGGVLASLVLVLALLVPSSSPVRAHGNSTPDVVGPEPAAARNYPVFAGPYIDSEFELAAARNSEDH